MYTHHRFLATPSPYQAVFYFDVGSLYLPLRGPSFKKPRQPRSPQRGISKGHCWAKMRSDWAPGAALLGTRWAGVSTSKEGQVTEGPDVIGPSEEGGVLGRCTISRWTVVTEPMSSLEPCEASWSSQNAPSSHPSNLTEMHRFLICAWCCCRESNFEPQIHVCINSFC